MTQKSERTWKHHAQHIVTSIDKIKRYQALYTVSDPEMYEDALYRNLHTISESADELPYLIKDKYRNINWRKIKDFRNYMVHAYLGNEIDSNIVNDVVENKLPELREAAIDMLTNIF